MPLERHFLDWSEPCLGQVAAWLAERYTDGSGFLNLQNVTVVTPGARAGRRLLEIVSEEAPGFLPPRMITVGSLPEEYYLPVQEVAPSVVSLFARTKVLQSVAPETLRKVFPHLPERSDLSGWFAIAQDLDRLEESLSADGKRIEDVASFFRSKAAFPDRERWEVLSECQELYEKRLETVGYTSKGSARLSALAAGDCKSDRETVLVACADIPAATRQMILRVAPNIPVHALIHAPESEAGAFDECGCIVEDEWLNRSIEIDDSSLIVANRPADQVYSVIETIAEMNADSPDEITVGIGDASLANQLGRGVESAGAAIRFAQGRAITNSRTFQALRLLSEFARSETIEALADLVRHPDLERFLLRATGSDSHSLTTLMDSYVSETFQKKRPDAWLEPDGAKVKKVYKNVQELLVDVSKETPSEKRGTTGTGSSKRRPLSSWANSLALLLEKLFGAMPLVRFRESDHAVIDSLQRIGNVLEEWSGISRNGAELSDILIDISFSEAVDLLELELAGQNIPPLGGAPAIEALGWLELQLDDAPHLIVTGFNEGTIPARATVDPFLPDSLKKALGLDNNSRRFARDKMILTAILKSRPDVKLVSGRWNTAGDPLMPSRLALAGSDDDLTRRFLAFYNEEIDDQPSRIYLEHRESNDLIIPPPLPMPEPLKKLRVTAFEAYLACPYRFYLNHILKLEELTDEQSELDALYFGSLAHEVLNEFALTGPHASPDEDEVRAYLREASKKIAATMFGPRPSAIIQVQISMLERRLDAFAQWQAEQAREGWQLAHAEAALQYDISVDEIPFTITGRVDRIDKHSSGKIRVLDYKTSTTAKSPEQMHRSGRKGEKQWRGFQLPLYRELIRGLDIDPDALGENLELGYVNLSAKGDVAYEKAEWDVEDFEEALEAVRDIIRAIRRQEFWPPADPATLRYTDGFAGLCMDNYIDRAAAIRLAESRALPIDTEETQS